MRFKIPRPIAARLDRSPPEPDLEIPSWTILADHREREGGWRFGELQNVGGRPGSRLVLKTREIHLVTADYTLESETGERLPCYVERKSHDDLIGSCGGGHVRLRAEFERMREIVQAGGYCCLICESSLDRIVEELSDPASVRRLDPNSILGIVASWPQRFGVPILFAGSRRLAEQLCYMTFRKFVERFDEQRQASLN